MFHFFSYHKPSNAHTHRAVDAVGSKIKLRRYYGYDNGRMRRSSFSYKIDHIRTHIQRLIRYCFHFYNNRSKCHDVLFYFTALFHINFYFKIAPFEIELGPCVELYLFFFCFLLRWGYKDLIMFIQLDN